MSEASAAAGDGPAEGGARKRRGSGLDSMVLPELKQLASSLGLKGTGAMRKGQLISAIQSAQTPGSGGGSSSAPSAGAPSNGAPSAGAPSNGGASNGDTADAGTSTRRRRSATRAAGEPAPTEAGDSHESPRRGDDIANALHELRENAPQVARETSAPADRPAQADTNGSGQETARQDTGRQDSAPQRPERRSDDSDRAANDREPNDRDSNDREPNDRDSNDRDSNDNGERRQRNRDGQRDRDARQQNGGQQNGGQQNGGQQNGGQQNGGQGQQRDGGSNGGQQRDNGTSRNGNGNGANGQARSQDNGANRYDDDEDGGGRRGRRRRSRDRQNRSPRATGRGGSGLERGYESEPTVSEDDVLVPARGILDVMDSYAFVRTSGYLPSPEDAYVSLAMVKKFG
ncbi:MAG: Rho termination factor N-terminal domain-containing protein, partial [Janthinobacterium lividum]